MTIATIQVLNVDAPSEVQTWLDAHPNITVVGFSVEDNVFYILYK